jgi:RNA polymerase sigma factor (sigma-70 family)
MHYAGTIADRKKIHAPSMTDVPALGALIGAVAAGDQDALSNLYELTVARVFAIARSIVDCKEDAEEIVCDVYLHVWQQAREYDAARGNVMAWLTIMARNRAIDRIRKRRNTVSLDDELQPGLTASLAGEDTAPDQILAQFQAGSAVHRALGSLTPLRRRLLGLAFFRGLSHREIAEALGLPLGTVKSHVRRSLAELQVSLRVDA